MKTRKRAENNILVLLRICTCLLAAVSFWATAQGMIEYTFPNDWQAYAASLGIQGLLLGLNFALPSFLRQCEDDIQKLALWVLTGVILFSSSWFSYLYIAQQAYGESWDTESRLLSQAVYRDELFDADNYVNLYSRDMLDTLADQVTTLYQQAMEIDQNSVNVSENLNWDEERTVYAADDFSARDIMLTVITAMENATGGDADQDAREQAVSILSGMQTNLQSEIDRVSTRISDIDTRVLAADTNLRSAEQRLSNMPVGVDPAPYQNAVSQASRTYESLIVQQNALEDQRSDYELAYQRTTYYLTLLGMAEDGVSSYFVGTNLREIQQELFQASPDSERMITLATSVFERLQSAVDLGGDTEEYQLLLSSMNDFLLNLENYSTIKASHAAIQELLDLLADGSILSLDQRGGNSDWKALWREQFNDLKFKISGLPVYTAQGENSSELASFDRAASTRNLDEAIRNYLTDHNAAQKGLIYLLSPYREVALFSLFLALLLDIAAFITGVIIDRVSATEETEQNEKMATAVPETEPKIDTDVAPETKTVEPTQAPPAADWSIVPGLNRYIFLTGDYTFLDGITTYKAIENGEEIEIEYDDRNLQTGFYRWVQKELCAVEQSVLSFKGVSGGPRDGFYLDCVLHYEDQLLTMTRSGADSFLGPVGPYVPVYQLSKEQYEVYPAKNISDVYGRAALIALNKDGTRIIAVYVIE